MSKRSWTLAGPSSAGMYVLELDGRTIHHHYHGDIVPPGFDGPTEESVTAVLLRGSEAGTKLDEVLGEIRASLHGWYELSFGARIHYDLGKPVEIDSLVMCSDSGLGGHRCTRGCAPRGPKEQENLVELAEKFAGGELQIGGWSVVPDEEDRTTSRERAKVRLHDP
jgi:hypothetical protein